MSRDIIRKTATFGRHKRNGHTSITTTTVAFNGGDPCEQFKLRDIVERNIILNDKKNIERNE